MEIMHPHFDFVVVVVVHVGSREKITVSFKKNSEERE